jgi:LmbE family N-acetylglucosaminyl deacetylase
MELSQPSARLFVPDGTAPAAALTRTTNLGIGAHPDDLEIMAWHGIGRCFADDSRWFSGVVVSDGGGGPRAGRFAAMQQAELSGLRHSEQRQAAAHGRYASLAWLGFPSDTVRRRSEALQDDLLKLLRATRPATVYTHSLADAHDTHLAVALHAIEAMRKLEPDERPTAVYGCEVWGSLDWLPPGGRVALDVSAHETLGGELIALHRSQCAGKSYPEATSGRKRYNATFGHANELDQASAIELAMDLTSLIHDPSVDPRTHVLGLVERFSSQLRQRLDQLA